MKFYSTRDRERKQACTLREAAMMGLAPDGGLFVPERIPQAPYFKKNDIPFGTSWNTAQNYTQGKTIKHYAAGLPFVRNAQTIEIPFANFGEVTVDRNAMLAYGASIARAVYRYLTENNGK